MVERVRPHRPDGHGEAWRALLAEEQRIKDWVKDGLTVVKIGILLRRHGVEVPHRTLARFAVERCGAGRRTTTVRVDDPPPGTELQVDFGRLGLVPDGERRTGLPGSHLHGVLQPAPVRLADVPPDHRGGDRGLRGRLVVLRRVSFPVVIPDNMKSIVIEAENTAPRFNDVFLEYAQSRGFLVDAARVRTPTDKPRVERVVPYVRNNFFAGETFVDLADCRRTGPRCGAARRPACASTAPPSAGRPRPSGPRSCPQLAAASRQRPSTSRVWSEPKLHRDFHAEVDRALYSAPHRFVGQYLKARRDSTTVKLYFRGELVKVHPRMPPGQRSTDPADYPHGKGDLRHAGRRQAEAGGREPRRGRSARTRRPSSTPRFRGPRCARSTGSSAS